MASRCWLKWICWGEMFILVFGYELEERVTVRERGNFGYFSPASNFLYSLIHTAIRSGSRATFVAHRYFVYLMKVESVHF